MSWTATILTLWIVAGGCLCIGYALGRRGFQEPRRYDRSDTP